MGNWFSAERTKSRFLSEDGSVSVEFVLWVPLIFFFFLLVTDASAAFMAQANMWHIAGDISRGIATGRITGAQASQLLQEYGHYKMEIYPSAHTVAVMLSQSYSNIGTGMALSFFGDMEVQVFQLLENGVQLSSGEI